VVVVQASNVKLMDGLAGIWSGFLPQYFTKAILLGAFQLTLPSFGQF
jgi:hypothetical protein